MKRGIFCTIGLLLVPVIILGAKEGYLGVYHKDLSEAMQLAIGVEHGVFIKKVVEDSPAEEAGIKKGDVILAINGEKIEDEDKLSDFIDENPGELVELTILRGGKELKLEAKLDEKKTTRHKIDIDIGDIDIGGSDEDVPGIAYMALLIPIIAIVMTLLIPIMAFYFGYRKRMLRSKERMLAIEKGIDLPPEPVPLPRIATPLNTLRKGFICLGIGVALVIFSIIAKFQSSMWFMGGGLILTFIGVAQILWYRVATRREEEK